MKTRLIISSVLIMLGLVFLPFYGAFAEESITSPKQTTQDNTSQKKPSTDQTSSDENQALDKGVAKIIGKAKTIETNTVALAKSYSFPILKCCLFGGAVLLVVGMVMGVISQRTGDGIKGSGIGLMISGIVAFVFMNFAPDIANKIISFVARFTE